MTSAYGGEPGDGKMGVAALALPVRATLRSGEVVTVEPFETAAEIEAGRQLMNEVIAEGRTWPFEEEFADERSYRAYFLSHAAFAVKTEGGDVAGAFYVKPNFPGRCGHVCNGGFITARPWRRRGVGRLMGLCFVKFAKDLGYRASYFNLVFASNEASVRLWDSLGFHRVAEIPRCARLRGLPELDTAYGYHFDLDTLPADYDPLASF